MTPVWVLGLPNLVVEEIQKFLPLHNPCWPEMNRGPTKSALAIKQLRKNMRLTLKEVQEQYSPTAEREGEDFPFAWAEHKRDILWDLVAEGRYPGPAGCFRIGCPGCGISNFLL